MHACARACVRACMRVRVRARHHEPALQPHDKPPAVRLRHGAGQRRGQVGHMPAKLMDVTSPLWPLMAFMHSPVWELHTCTLPRQVPVTMVRPSGSQAAEEGMLLCISTATRSILAVPQTMTSLSKGEHVMIDWPSGEKATEQRLSALWGTKVLMLSPVSVLQIVAVPSKEPVRMHFPSGEKVAAKTAEVWPVRVKELEPSWVSHTLAVQSSEPVTMSRPSSEKATGRSGPECPASRNKRLPEAVSQTMAVVSREEVTRNLPSSENDADITALW
mmetsp:Transcript_109736/g.342025  ORF Transcript_109736/g.342025 Transcript_109736/m.342025 type:complete len:274 (-) Transcript_109736:506-1327(-)